MRLIKICFITNFAYRLFNQKSSITFGGNEVLYYLISQELVKNKRFVITFLLEDDVHKNPKTERVNNVWLYKLLAKNRHQKPSFEIGLAMTIFRKFAEKFPNLWQLPHLDFFRFWKTIKKIKADVYIKGSAGYELGIVVFLAKLFRKKVIFLVGHDDDVNQVYVKNNKTLGRIYEYGLKNTDLIWCTSKRHQKILKKNYQLKSLCLPYWFPTQQKILSLAKRQNILWVARVDKWKNPEAFLKLAKKIPEENFLMIGSISDNDSRLFDQIKAKAQKIKNLTFKQNVPFSQIIAYYQKAKLFIDTSDYASMHTSHLMAAACGTPAVTLFKDPNNSFGRYGWGLTAGSDFKKFKKQIRQILSHASLWQVLSEKALGFSLSVHNLENNLQQFKKALLSL